MKTKFTIATLMAFLVLITSCKDTFRDINDDPGKTPDPRIEFLFTAGLFEMNAHNYYIWYKDLNHIQGWMQMTASSGGNTSQMMYMRDVAEEFGNAINVKRQHEAIKFEMGKNAETSAIYTHLEAMMAPMTIYMGLLATDGSGSMPYSEAGKAFFDGEAAFRPKFDSQKELFETWLAELKTSIETLSTEKFQNEKGDDIPQFNLRTLDYVYKGDRVKWAKFANGLRLKIAARLLHQDIEWAKQVVAEVMKYPLPETEADNFVWNPGTRWFNSGNNFEVSTGAKNTISFLVENQDPRVRFIYRKNQYNEEIVDGLLKNGNSLPSYIENVIEKETIDGKYRFKAWKAPGEPWVRYHGVPADFASIENTQSKHDYYEPSHREMGEGQDKKIYTPWSGMMEPMIKGSYVFDYPALPGVTPKRDDRERPTHLTYMNVAEVNLYLAEFKTLGFASIPGNASDYFNTAVEASVKMYDTWAAANKVPYYEEASDVTSDVTIGLKDGEIAHLLSQPAYQLTGSKKEQLEKIYIQMYINFALFPQDQFATVRRSGVPMKDSQLLAPEVWDSRTTSAVIVPRRYAINSVSPTDELYESRMKAYEDQKFTPGQNDPTTLNKERLWYDQGAPEYGEGPNL